MIEATTELDLAPNDLPLGDDGLFEAVSRLIEDTRATVAYQMNAISVQAAWRLGYLVHVEILHRGRADYGKQIVATLSHQLTDRYGSGYDKTNLNRMVKFAREFPREIGATVSHQLSWSHIRELLPVTTLEARLFYAEAVAAKRLGVRELRDAIRDKAYERREIANSQIPTGSSMPTDAFLDPFLLDFLGLKGVFLEADLEQAVLISLEQFLLEFGHGLTFVGRQIRIPWGDRDYHLDMLFYSRTMRRLVAVDFKIGEFEPEFEGQMKFYLKWLERYERREGESAPIGLILCASANRYQVEMMELHKDNIVVAEYWTELLPKKELEERLQMLLRQARERMARRVLVTAAQSVEGAD